MNLDEIKSATAALSADEREQLVNYLVCVGVTEDPAWQASVRQSVAAHADRFEQENTRAMRVAEEG